jgi:flagellar biosynthesis/type III secretory pathway protein FliH
MNLSRAYKRHDDAYDSRFEKYYAEGYRKGWDEG